MEVEKIVKTISNERFSSYQKRYPNDLRKSFLLYQSNIEISQSFYSNLSILEISLRNTINQSCIKHFDTENWLKEKLPKELKRQILEIENKLKKSGKEPTNDRIIAELNFGFWTTLFNRSNAKIFWKPLLKAFPYLPKKMRKRTSISPKLNRLRTFRNRIYHYDPIVWDIRELVSRRAEIDKILTWIEPETDEKCNLTEYHYYKNGKLKKIEKVNTGYNNK